MDELFENAFLKGLASKAQVNDPINPDLYQEYDVKRGLRNANGTGVLVGLTRIGDVVGYEVHGGKTEPAAGKLYYRGYDINDIVKDAERAHRTGYEECAYLLLFGELPTEDELSDFMQVLGTRRRLPPNFLEDMILKAPSADLMNKIASGVLSSYSYDADPEGRSVANNMRQCIELIARMPTLAAYAYQAKRHYFAGHSMYIHNPIPSLSTAANFLRLIRRDKQYTPLEEETLDIALMLHAEHGGGNNSSLTVHVVSSADTDTYSAISAAIGSLKGRRHGGANARVMDMIDDIKTHVTNWGDAGEVAQYLMRIADKDAFDRTGLIYGMGHAVYTISDPRQVLLQGKARQLAQAKGRECEMQLYETIARIAPPLLMQKHPTGKRICPNVDFYSGFVYDLLDIPRELHTPLFAISRIAGWSAHRIEELVAGGRIYRPAYKNISPVRRYKPLKDR